MEGWQTSEILACLSVLRYLTRYPKGCVQISWNENICRPGWSEVHELVIQGENVFPPENRKAEILMENAAIWLRSCLSMSWKWDNPATFCHQPSVVSFFTSFPCPQCSALLPVPALCYRISPDNSTEMTFLQHKAREMIWGSLCTCNSGQALEMRILIKRSKPFPETNVKI